MGAGLLALSIGTWPGWLTVFGVLFLCIFMWRGQVGPAMGYLTSANRVLKSEIEELQKRDKQKDRELAELQTKTDVTIALKPLLEWTQIHETSDQQRHRQTIEAMKAVVNALNGHEDREAERHTQFLNLVELVAERVGPEKNGPEKE